MAARARADAAAGDARVADAVRRRDRDRYLCDLFAPEAARRHLFALHAFNAEIARVRDAVSDPTLGEIRLQWWRDAIANRAASGHPIADALIAAIETFHLPEAAFQRMIDSRVVDLYDDALPTLRDLEGYAGDTASALFQLAAIVLAGGQNPGTAEGAGHAGVAFALTGILRSLHVNARRGQTFLPNDMIVTRKLDTGTLARGERTAELKTLLRDLGTIARQHLAEAEREIGDLVPPVRAAFLPVALVEPHLKRMERDTYDPFSDEAELPPWRRQWIIWRAARRA